MQEPRLVEIKDGWAALGEGWAVFGATPDDALERYVAADEKHAELRARPVDSPAPSPGSRPLRLDHSPSLIIARRPSPLVTWMPGDDPFNRAALSWSRLRRP